MRRRVRLESGGAAHFILKMEKKRMQHLLW